MNVSIRNNKGFSLVELMVVVAIIGILAAIAIPNFQRFTAKSKQSEVKANLSMLYSAERAFNSEWQVYNTQFQMIGYAPTGAMRYNTGFTAAYNTTPQNYTGPSLAVSPSIDAVAYCGIAASGCSIVTLPNPPGAFPALAATTAISFVAGGVGDIVGANIMDQWTIDQLKTLTNAQNGLP